MSNVELSVDCVILRLNARKQEVLLIKRKNPPFQWQRALPGWFVESDERIHEAALRELVEETGLVWVSLEYVAYFDQPDRDPRGRNVSHVFCGHAGDLSQYPLAGDDAQSCARFAVDSLPALAFDHEAIIYRVMSI